MSVLFILISASLVVATGFLLAFIKAVRSGQYDDNYTPSVRMLFDDATIGAKPAANSAAPVEKQEAGINNQTAKNV